MDHISVIDIINLAAGLASLILAALAIWLALYFYKQSKAAETTTEVNVSEMKKQTEMLVSITDRVLDKFTDYSTSPKAADETFLVLANMLSSHSVQSGTAQYPANQDLAQLNKFAIDATITAFFYAGISNLSLQDLLPERRGDIQDDNNIPALLDASYEDFNALAETLQGVDAVAESGVYNVYQVAAGMQGAGSIKSVDTLYTVPLETQD